MRSWTDEQLKLAVVSNIGFAGVIRDLGRSRGPGNWRTIKRRIAELGLSTAHFRGKAHGTTAQKSKRPLHEILRVGTVYSSCSLRKRLVAAGLLQNRCSRCDGEPLWQGETLTLQLDHINGDPFDNRLVNLQILCPNCHAQTATYKGRNGKNRGRYSTEACVNCGNNVVRSRTKLCRRCYQRTAPHKLHWPDAQLVAAEVVATSYKDVAQRLGVSTISVRRYLIRSNARRSPKLVPNLRWASLESNEFLRGFNPALNDRTSSMPKLRFVMPGHCSG